jgi:hypothetical protein
MHGASLCAARVRARRTVRWRCTVMVTAHRRTETAGRRRLTSVETTARCVGRWVGARGGGSGNGAAQSETGRRERGGAVRASAARARRSTGEGRERGGGRQLCCQDARCAVLIAALSRCADATRGGHAVAARCRACPVRRATADKRDPLVSDFQIKIYPEGN